MKHKWKELDDIKVLYITLYGIKNISYSKNDIAKQIGVSLGSLNMRIGNFKAIQGQGKLTNYAKLSKRVYEKYNSLSETTLKKIAFI